jgi:hypothetical protein
MSDLMRKTIKLLLIITIMIQPVTFSCAMANEDNGHHENHSMSEGMADHNDQNTHEGDSELDNCPYTAVCNPMASVMNIVTVPHAPNSLYVAPNPFSVKSVDLPTEIKPPRSLLG